LVLSLVPSSGFCNESPQSSNYLWNLGCMSMERGGFFLPLLI
jgi:hypothetical protein